MPDSYRLTLEIPATALAAVVDTHRVIVARACGNALPNRVWVAARPAVRTVVSWHAEYGIYAALPNARNGTDALPIIGGVYPARHRMVYPFSGREFEGPRERRAIPAGHYDVRNGTEGPLTFGLLQAVTLNGWAAISALNGVVVPASFTADFSAGENVHVWLLRADDANGGVVGAAVRDTETVISFTRRSPEHRCVLDERTGVFVARPAG
jgi:hypothetical protein